MYHGTFSSNLAIPTSLPHRPSFTRYNLSFNIANSKSLQKSTKLSPQKYKEDFLEFLDKKDKNTRYDSFHKTAYHSSMGSAHSATFYSTRKQFKNKNDNEDQVTFKKEMKVIRAAFPKRKQKSGEQQLLKLLMKYSSTHHQRGAQLSPNINKAPLFAQNPENKQGIVPKLKTRTRFNWKKNLYCVNRDKESSLQIKESEISKRQLSYKINALRKNLMQQKLLQD